MRRSTFLHDASSDIDGGEEDDDEDGLCRERDDNVTRSTSQNVKSQTGERAANLILRKPKISAEEKLISKDNKIPAKTNESLKWAPVKVNQRNIGSGLHRASFVRDYARAGSSGSIAASSPLSPDAMHQNQNQGQSQHQHHHQQHYQYRGRDHINQLGNVNGPDDEDDDENYRNIKYNKRLIASQAINRRHPEWHDNSHYERNEGDFGNNNDDNDNDDDDDNTDDEVHEQHHVTVDLDSHDDDDGEGGDGDDHNENDNDHYEHHINTREAIQRASAAHSDEQAFGYVEPSEHDMKCDKDHDDDSLSSQRLLYVNQASSDSKQTKEQTTSPSPSSENLVNLQKEKDQRRQQEQGQELKTNTGNQDNDNKQRKEDKQQNQSRFKRSITTIRRRLAGVPHSSHWRRRLVGRLSPSKQVHVTQQSVRYPGNQSPEHGQPDWLMSPRQQVDSKQAQQQQLDSLDAIENQNYSRETATPTATAIPIPKKGPNVAHSVPDFARIQRSMLYFDNGNNHVLGHRYDHHDDINSFDNNQDDDSLNYDDDQTHNVNDIDLRYSNQDQDSLVDVESNQYQNQQRDQEQEQANIKHEWMQLVPRSYSSISSQQHKSWKFNKRSIAAHRLSSVFCLYATRYARDKLYLALRAFRSWYHNQLTYHKLANRMEFNPVRFEHWFRRRGSPLALRTLDHYDQVVVWIADERDAIQTKTFAKWINKYLGRRGQHLNDLFEDLRDGQNLLTLIEMLSGQDLPRERGKMRVHKLQNIQIALNYIRYRKVKLVNIRPEDIVDGNQKLTLGLIWTIILHFQLEDNSNFREILLRWAQKTTDGYPGCKVTDLTTSWRDGLAFNAIIHRNRPDLLDYRACKKMKTNKEKIEQAFRVAHEKLDVARLLDPEDVDVPQPDEKSMITYLSQLYELFPDPPERNPLLDEEMMRRINEYKQRAGALVKWIRDSTKKLDERHFPKALAELRRLRDDTERFRCEEVPPKQHDKTRLAKVAPEIYDMAAELNVRLDNELHSNNIDRIWDQMMQALSDRARAIDDEMAKAERLKALLEKLLNDIKKTNERLDVVERDLNEEERRVSRIETLQEAERYPSERFQKLGEQLAEIGIKIDGIKRLAEDFIKEAGKTHPDSIMIREKVADLDGRYKRLLAKLANIHDQFERTFKRLREMDDMRREQMRKEAEAKLRLKLDAIKRELDDLERRIDSMGPVSRDLATLQRQLAELREFDQDLSRTKANLNDVITLAEAMIKDDLIADPPHLRSELQALKDQLARIEDKAARRLREFDEALQRAERVKAAEEQINMKLDALRKILDDLERRIDSMAPVSKDLNVLKKQLAEMQEFERDLKRAGRELQDTSALADDLISRELISDPISLRSSVKQLKDQYERIEDKAAKRLRAIQDGLKHAEAQRAAESELTMRLDGIKRELEELERRLDAMEPIGKDLVTLKRQLIELQDFEQDLNNSRRKLNEAANLADELIRQDLISEPAALRASVRNLKELLARIDDKFNRRMKALLDAMKRVEQQEAAEKKYRLRLDEMRRELEELERQLDGMDPVGKDLAKLQKQLTEIKQFIDKLDNVTKKKLTDLLKMGDDLILDNLIMDPAKLKLDMKQLKDLFDRINEKAQKRLRDICDAMSRCEASDAIQEVAQWLDRARKVLVDEENVHGDLDTVNALVEQHKAFQSELLSRQPAIAEVRRMEAQLSSSSPQSGAEIRDKLSALSNQWREMEKLTRDKSNRLDEAMRVAQQLHNSVHSLLEWLAELEMKLRFAGPMAEDEVAAVADKQEHELLERKLNTQEQAMGQTIKLAQDILTKCHPDAEPVIKHWINIIQSRWDEIDAWAKQRGQRLDEHLRALREILHLVEELVNWLARHEARLLGEEAELTELPNDLSKLDSLIEQHSTFVDELRKREPNVDRAIKIFGSRNGPSTSKVVLTTTTTTSSPSAAAASVTSSSGGSKTRENSVTRSGRLSAAGARSATPTRTSYATYRDEYPEVKQPRAKVMLDKWRSVWQLSLDKMQRLKDRSEHLRELERLENFDFDDWRRRFLSWITANKGRAMDFFRSLDDDNDNRIPCEAFVTGVLRSRFESSRLEMERVADIIDKNRDGSIDNREFMDSLRPDKPVTDDELIQDEVQRQVSKCTCNQRYRVYHVGDGKYRFGESQKLRLVRILRSTVMVRVGGGWDALSIFLQKNDPCRAKGRTNVELREQFILPEGASQAMAAFKSRLSKSPTSMGQLGPITKIREKTDRSMPMSSSPSSRASSSRFGSPSAECLSEPSHSNMSIGSRSSQSPHRRY